MYSPLLYIPPYLGTNRLLPPCLATNSLLPPYLATNSLLPLFGIIEKMCSKPLSQHKYIKDKLKIHQHDDQPQKNDTGKDLLTI